MSRQFGKFVPPVRVRSWAQDGKGSHVVLETEQGQIFTVYLLDNAPPVWQGLHGVFAYESASKDAGTWKNFIVKQRLPDAVQEGGKK